MRLAPFAIAILLAIPACAQDVAPAQVWKDKGLAAATAGDWKQAVDLLQQAHALAPHDATILYSLGVVYGEAGDDVPAMYWLKSYLAAAPSASNAVAVTAEIVAREKAAAAKEDQIYQAALKAARQLDAGSRPDCLSRVAEQEAAAGHLEAALHIVNGEFAVALAQSGVSWEVADRQQEMDRETEAARKANAAFTKWLGDKLALWQGSPPLNVWLGEAERAAATYQPIDLNADVAAILSGGSRVFSDPTRVPGFLAEDGTPIGKGLALFHALEDRQ